MNLGGHLPTCPTSPRTLHFPYSSSSSHSGEGRAEALVHNAGIAVGGSLLLTDITSYFAAENWWFFGPLTRMLVTKTCGKISQQQQTSNQLLPLDHVPLPPRVLYSYTSVGKRFSNIFKIQCDEIRIPMLPWKYFFKSPMLVRLGHSWGLDKPALWFMEA